MHNVTTTQAQDVGTGERFAFGENWTRFLALLSSERIEEAKNSLLAMLQCESLAGTSFVDAGSGSGLFSLAARMLGARVHSFDFDPASVACTAKLKNQFFPGDEEWHVEEGSVLDQDFLSRLGKFDVVYSWGVLHHTGNLWSALENISGLTLPGGKLMVAIYNDQGGASRRWLTLKKLYNQHPILRLPLVTYTFFRQWTLTFLRDAFKGQPVAAWRNYQDQRGMSPWHDILDWIGGLPFEVSSPDRIFDFLSARGFTLRKLKTCAGGIGCNEYVFEKTKVE